MAEGVRFELTESLTTLNGFRGRRLQPLGHPSGKLIRNAFKTPSKAQWLRCRPPINAHIPNVCCAFSISLRLALEPDLRL